MKNCKSTLANGPLKHSSGIYISRGLFVVCLHNDNETKLVSVHNGLCQKLKKVNKKIEKQFWIEHMCV